MGKKTRKEREEKRESFAAKRTREKRKNSLIAAAVIGVIVVIVGYSGYIFATGGASAPGAPPGAGTLGSEHEHAVFLVRIFGDQFDFSSSAFQVKSSWIHFESQDGTTLHCHATGVTLGYLFESLKIALDDQCYIFPDGREFCTNDDYSIKFFINHLQVPDIRDYVVQEGDRILISYGNEDAVGIDKQLAELDTLAIIG